MQFGCLKLVHFSKNLGRLSSTSSEILTFGSHCSANFQPIFDCFILKFKLEYEDLENIKTDCVNAVVFNLHQIKRLKFFLGHLVFQLFQPLQLSQFLRWNRRNRWIPVLPIPEKIISITQKSKTSYCRKVFDFCVIQSALSDLALVFSSRPIKMSPRFVLGQENVPCVAGVVSRWLKADCTDFICSILDIEHSFYICRIL